MVVLFKSSEDHLRQLFRVTLRNYVLVSFYCFYVRHFLTLFVIV